MDVDRYLHRLDYHGPRTPTPEVLEALHVAHLRAVPFENLSIHRSDPDVLDCDALFDKIVVRRRGGFCYEQNGLFAALLRARGFVVRLLSARVRQKDGAYSPDFDHLALLVDLEEPYLADVGFGEAFLRPLRLREGLLQRQGAKAFALDRSGEVWTLLDRSGQESPEALYRFTLAPRVLSGFAGRCRYHASSSESHFAKKTVCTRATPGGRITLSGDRYIVTEDGVRSERTVTEAEHAELLARSFGIVLGAPAQRTPSPAATDSTRMRIPGEDLTSRPPAR